MPQHDAFAASFAAQLAAPASVVLVAESGSSGEIIGYLAAHAHPALFANGPVAWIEELMVVESRRRAGIGGRLVDGAEAWAAERGAAYVALATRRAAAFYDARGYEESAVFFRKLLGSVE